MTVWKIFTTTHFTFWKNNTKRKGKNNDQERMENEYIRNIKNFNPSGSFQLNKKKPTRFDDTYQSWDSVVRWYKD